MRWRNSMGSGDDIASEHSLWCGLALFVGWSAPRMEIFADRIGGQLRAWLDGHGPPPQGDDFDFLTKTQRKDLGNLRRLGAEVLKERMDGWSDEVVVWGDDDYPAGLEELKRPPSGLHIRGSRAVLRRRGIAVVGSRKIGVSAATAARRLLESAVRQKMVVVSGGALGSDAVAHRCAVDIGGVTAAVLPSGLSNPTPKTNRRLFGDIIDSGGVLISEYAPDCGVRRYHFRRRNQLMAAMSLGVLVLRAGESSGTMLTVDAARELERPLAAMPGTPDDPLSQGCHDILRRGGKLVATADDLVDWWEELGGDVAIRKATDDGDDLAPSRPDCAVLDCAERLVDARGGFSVESLVRETGQPAAKLQSKLLEYELAGVIERTTGGDRFRFRH